MSEETLKELVNIVSVEGYIGTKPATKIVTYGGKVTNFMFVIRGEKDFIPTYIPVIAWGDKQNNKELWSRDKSKILCKDAE